MSLRIQKIHFTLTKQTVEIPKAWGQSDVAENFHGNSIVLSLFLPEARHYDKAVRPDCKGTLVEHEDSSQSASCGRAALAGT